MFYNILMASCIRFDSCQRLEGRRALCEAHLSMSKHIAKTPVWIGILLCILFLFAVTALAEESPITVKTAEPSPKTLSGPGTVQVSISISNSSDSSVPVNVMLTDPAGNICTSFGSGGSASIPQGQAVVYSGSWAVSQKELDAGKITYSARFSFQNEEGQSIPGSKPISIPIKQNTAVADLYVQRVPPTPMNGAVVQGQTVVLAYQIKNVGTVDLTDITITDPSITADVVKHPRLKPGETETLTYTYVADASSKTSDATITFNYEQGGKTLSKIASSKPFVLNVTVPELVVTLKADTLMVNPGTKVKLTYTISNKGNLKYEQIKITDPLLLDVESGLSLEGGKEYTNTREVTVNATGTYQFSVTGTSSAGPITVSSEPVTIQTIAEGTPLDTAAGDAIPIELVVEAEVDRDIIYEEPTDVVFHVVVTNNGTTEVKSVNIYERGKLVKTIPTIAAGESAEFTKRFTVSSGGLYQFVAVAKDNKGEDQKAQSQEVLITYKPLPVPTPRPTPVPTPSEVPSATDDPLLSQQNTNPNVGIQQEPVGMGTVLLYILAGLLVIVLMAVGVLVILERRRSNPQPSIGFSGQSGAVVIDTIQRGQHRDYARAPKRSSAQKRDAANSKETPDEPQMMESVPQRDDRAAPKEEPTRRQQKANTDQEREQAPAPVSDKQRENAFKRPESQPVEEKTEPPVDVEDVQEPEVENKRDYLGSIRKGRREEAKAEAETRKKSLSEEEAALLSGSTGQYRLSRGTKTSLPNVQPSKAQDAESFSRKQRATRAQKLDAVFYDDDEDEAVNESPGRNRRK